LKSTVMKKTITDQDLGLDAYFPIMESDVKRINKQGEGEVFTIDIKQDRFYPLLQKYWATCNLVAQNKKAFHELDELNTKELVDEYVRLKVGHIEARIVIKDHVHIKTKSIGYDALDDEQFREFFDNAIEVLSWISGISVHDLSVNWMEYEAGIK